MEEPLCPMSIQNCDSVNHVARWEANTWILTVEKSLLKESDITTMSIPTFWLCSSLSVWNLFCPCLLPRNMTMPTTSARPFQMPEIGLGPMHAHMHNSWTLNTQGIVTPKLEASSTGCFWAWNSSVLFLKVHANLWFVFWTIMKIQLPGFVLVFRWVQWTCKEVFLRNGF